MTTTTTTAAEQVAGNKYLLEEILIRLPAKSVTRSKLVSKQWCSRISGPQFVVRHSQQSPNKSHTGMFLTDSKRDCRYADFVPFNELNSTYQTIPSLGFLYDGIREVHEIVNACNGLFLCIVNANYCVSNPTTKTFRLLPPAPPLSLSSEFDHYLAFDPCVSIHYKVICITRFKIKDFVILNIYSSEDRFWKTVQTHLSPAGQGFFLNGSIYWLSDKINLCFDVYNEEMKQIDVPPKTSPCFSTSLAVVGSHLYYLARKGESTPDFRLCEMNSDFSEWVTKYDASVGPLLSAFPQIALLLTGGGEEDEEEDEEEVCLTLYCFFGMCVVEGVNEDEAQLVLGIRRKVLLYNLKEKTGKELYNLDGKLGGQFEYSHAQAFQFIETLCVV